jgi:hypothetical protein
VGIVPADFFLADVLLTAVGAMSNSPFGKNAKYSAIE